MRFEAAAERTGFRWRWRYLNPFLWVWWFMCGTVYVIVAGYAVMLGLAVLFTGLVFASFIVFAIVEAVS